MIEWGGFALLRPWWLLALPALAPPLWRGARGGRLAGWTEAMDASLARAMRRLGRVLPGRPPARWVPAAIAAALALALAGPAVRNERAPSFHNLDGVVVVLDLSRSVALGGALDTALAAGRLAAEGSAGRPVALVVYAGDGYVASPFTTDARAVGTTIAALDGETVPDGGSAPARGLAEAARLITETATLASDVLLISDGAGAAAARGEVEALARAGARVSTLYVAPKARVSDMPAPDPDALAALAAAGGGAAGEAARPGPVLAAAAERASASPAAADVTLLTFRDLGKYFLALPALLALALFRRSA